MKVITYFRKIRSDGKIIDESMTAGDIIRSGWQPAKVTALQWVCETETITIRSDFALLGTITRDREFLAVIESLDEDDHYAALKVYTAYGALQHTYPNAVTINGAAEAGTFSWFETATSEPQSTFGVVFRVARNGAMYRVEIDAATKDILMATETR